MAFVLSFNRSHALVCAALAAVVVSGCGSNNAALLASEEAGGTGSTINTAAVPVPAAFTSMTTSPTVVGGSTVLGQTGSALGYTAGETLPNASAPQVTISETVSSTPPTGVAVLMSRARAAAGMRSTSSTFQGTVIDYVTISANNTVTFTGAPVFTFVLPYIPTGYNLYLAEYNAASGIYNEEYAGPAKISGDQLTFTGPVTPALAFTGTNAYTFALYALPTSDTPIAYVGTGTVTATPSSLTFATSGSATQTFTASESLNGAAEASSFTAASDTPAVATVAPSATTGTFTVTPIGAGTATITVTAEDGATTPVSVTVSGVPVTVSGHRA